MRPTAAGTAAAQLSNARANATAKPTPAMERPETTDASQTSSRSSTHTPCQTRMPHSTRFPAQLLANTEPRRRRFGSGCGLRPLGLSSSALGLLARELLEQPVQLFGNGLRDDLLEHGSQLAPDVLLDRGSRIPRRLLPRAGRPTDADATGSSPSEGLCPPCLLIVPFALCANALHNIVPDISFRSKPPVRETIDTADEEST